MANELHIHYVSSLFTKKRLAQDMELKEEEFTLLDDFATLPFAEYVLKEVFYTTSLEHRVLKIVVTGQKRVVDSFHWWLAQKEFSQVQERVRFFTDGELTQKIFDINFVMGTLRLND